MLKYFAPGMWEAVGRIEKEEEFFFLPVARVMVVITYSAFGDMVDKTMDSRIQDYC